MSKMKPREDRITGISGSVKIPIKEKIEKIAKDRKVNVATLVGEIITSWVESGDSRDNQVS